MEWEFSCNKCGEISALIPFQQVHAEVQMCSAHTMLQSFLNTSAPMPPIFIGLSSIGRQVSTILSLLYQLSMGSLFDSSFLLSTYLVSKTMH